MKIKIIFIMLLVILPFLIGCEQDNLLVTPGLNYVISGCNEEKEVMRAANTATPGPKIYIEENYIIMSHNLSYVCCANLTLDEKIENNSIVIIEENVGDYCRCMCDYNIDAQIGPMESGTYQIKIYGVKYQNSEPNLLLDQEAEI